MTALFPRRLTFWSCILALAVSTCAADQDPTIQIGLAAPLKIGAGEAALKGALLAVEQINRDGGVLGRPLQIIARDDRMEAERAIQIANEFHGNRGIVAVVGHLTSGATIAAGTIYNDPAGGLLSISPGATSPELSAAGEWTFRVCPSDIQQGAALADWAYSRLGLQRAAVIYPNDQYGRGVLNAFVPAFERLGGTVVARDPFLVSLIENETTLDPYLERAIRERMDALVIIGVGDEVAQILTAARRLGYQGAVMGPDGLIELADAGEIADGVYFTSGFLADRDSNAAQRFVRQYVDRHGELPRDGAAHAYDAVRLLARAIEEVGTDRRAIRDYIADVGGRHPAHEGVTGTIRFDEFGDVRGKLIDIGIVRNGRVTTAR